MLIYPCTSIPLFFFFLAISIQVEKKSMNMFGYIIGNHPPLVLVSIKMAFEWNPVVASFTGIRAPWGRVKAGSIPVKPTPKGFTQSKGCYGLQENSCDTARYHGKKVKILMGISKIVMPASEMSTGITFFKIPTDILCYVSWPTSTLKNKSAQAFRIFMITSGSFGLLKIWKSKNLWFWFLGNVFGIKEALILTFFWGSKSLWFFLPFILKNKQFYRRLFFNSEV